jgi:hypothetical protein
MRQAGLQDIYKQMHMILTTAFHFGNAQPVEFEMRLRWPDRSGYLRPDVSRACSAAARHQLDLGWDEQAVAGKLFGHRQRSTDFGVNESRGIA